VRYLTIVRHAKAERAAPDHSDVERRLNDRGRRQCEELRAWASDLNELGRFGPTTALVSAAARTRETFQLAFEGTGFVAECLYSELIYNGLRDVSADDVLIDLAAIDPVTTSLLVVGHNPTVLDFIWTLCDRLPESLRDGFPLAGAYVLAIPDDQQVGRPLRTGLERSQDGGVALTAAATERHGGDPATATTQFGQGAERDARAGHAHRVTQRDGATVDVHLLLADAEVVAGGETDRGEGLVDLEDVDVANLDVGLLRRLEDRSRGLSQ
jgi:phosphohistidine phosphatase SixA